MILTPVWAGAGPTMPASSIIRRYAASTRPNATNSLDNSIESLTISIDARMAIVAGVAFAA